MNILSKLSIGLVAVEHVYILWFEMFAWERKGPKIFRNFPKDLFPKTVALAANQGLYNGFLAVGLAWSLFIEDPTWGPRIASYFLGCVAVAGAYGAYSASKRILYVQTVPALLGLAMVQLGL